VIALVTIAVAAVELGAMVVVVVAVAVAVVAAAGIAWAFSTSHHVGDNVVEVVAGSFDQELLLLLLFSFRHLCGVCFGWESIAVVGRVGRSVVVVVIEAVAAARSVGVAYVACDVVVSVVVGIAGGTKEVTTEYSHSR